MRLTDIYNNRIDETLDTPIPYTKINNNRYDIQLNEQNVISIILRLDIVNQIKCLSLLFVNKGAEYETQTTRFFNGPGAIRVFSTIIAIIKPIEYDLIFFNADDINVEVENKKIRLYKVIVKKLERMGLLAQMSSTLINIPEWNKPIFVGIRSGSKGVDLTQEQIINLIKKVGMLKLSGQ